MSRPPLERMMRIHQAIQAGKYPNATSLAGELEVSTKSIHRDLEFMRDRLGLPLEYDGRRVGYHYTEEVSSFPTLQMTEGELFALLVAEKALQQYRGTPFERPLMSVFKKISFSLPDPVSVHLGEWQESISFQTRAEPVVDLGIFDELAKATAERRQLLLSYRKPGRKETEERKIDPYHLANVNGEWFLFAYCHLRRGIRTFVPSRIQGLKRTGTVFKGVEKFSVEKRLRDSFGIHSGDGEFEIRIRFDELVADYIREKKWHASQQLKELKGGGVELGLKLSSLVEIQRWVLGWGGHARVLHPPELAEAVGNAAREIWENYTKGQ